MAGFNTSGAAQGAVVGSQVMPGWGTAAGALLGGFSGGGGSGVGGIAAPQDATSAIYGDLGLDGSGWNVNFSGMQSNGSNKGAPSGLEAAGIPSGGVLPLAMVGIVVIVGLALWKKSK